MRTISMFVALLLSCQGSWSQNGHQPSNYGRPTGTASPSSNSTQRAQDGDVYTAPSSVQPRPRGHGRETNTGRPPTPAHNGSDTGWIIGGAAAAGGAVALGEWLHARNKPESRLSREGPKMPDQFTMSGLSIAAFAQANWPVVVDGVFDSGGILLITVEVNGLSPFTYRIQNPEGRRRLDIFRLPPYFPQKPTPGTYTIRAMRDVAGSPRPIYLRLFGVGAGERAVGSVAIDEVRFGPEAIRPKQKENASYGFHAHTDFDRVRAEFLKAVTTQGQIVSKLEDHNDIHGVQRETAPAFQWSAKKATPGEHILQVRAWESALNKANWVIAWSADQVLVEE